jgi:superoxide reductase
MEVVMKVYKCNKCGNVIELLDYKSNNIKCCDTDMVLLKVNTEDAAKEKHVPYVEIDEDRIYVKVGETTHPMDDSHYIMWIAADYGDSVIRFNLNPGEEPEAYFDYMEGMKIYAYCNLHGLWMKEV